MVDNLCNKIATYFASKHNKRNISFEVYRYGLQLIMSSIGIMLFIICISCIFDTFIMGLLYFVIYIPLKVTCGGYHAKTVIKCFVASVINYFSVMILAKWLSTLYLPIWVWLCILGFNIIFIAVSAPVKNKKHNVGKSVAKKNKKYSLIIIGILGTALIITYLTIEPMYILNYIVLTIASIAIGILLTNKGGKKHVRIFD